MSRKQSVMPLWPESLVEELSDPPPCVSEARRLFYSGVKHTYYGFFLAKPRQLLLPNSNSLEYSGTNIPESESLIIP
jgi:hypothetical protein